MAKGESSPHVDEAVRQLKANWMDDIPLPPRISEVSGQGVEYHISSSIAGTRTIIFVTFGSGLGICTTVICCDLTLSFSYCDASDLMMLNLNKSWRVKTVQVIIIPGCCLVFKFTLEFFFLSLHFYFA